MSNEVTSNLKLLGQRVLDSKNWKWLDGMKANVPYGDYGSEYSFRLNRGEDHGKILDGYPDLSDDGTIGIVLGHLRKICNHAEIHVVPSWTQSGERVWNCNVRKNNQKVWRIYSGVTEAEALVVALEKV